MPKRYVQPGDVVRLELPCSEVCMHMRVAETIRRVRVEPGGRWGPSAQILNDSGTCFSIPILMSEAGFYRDGAGWYYYPPSLRLITSNAA
jgi:hypothetical protein